MGRRRTSPYSAPAPKCLVATSRPGAGALAVLAGAVVALWWVAGRFERVAITGTSMEPALVAGDRLVVWRSTSVRPGDIVAARDPRHVERTVLKRALAVGAEEVWLEGDNADHSTDSRHFGPVPMDLVEGRAFYRYAPPARAGRLPRKEVADATKRLRC